MKTLAIRTTSALVFAIVMVAGILGSSLTFLGLMLIILGGSLREYLLITSEKRSDKTPFKGQVFFGVMLVISFLASYLLLSPPVRGLPEGNIFSMLFQVIMMQRDADIAFTSIIPMVAFGLFAIELFSKNENPFTNIGWNLIAVVWILVPMMLTNKIYFEQGGVFLLTVFCIIWFYDSACYASGSLFGKHPLFARISPKKTWEGLFAGVVFTLVAAYFLNLIPGMEILSRGEWMFLSFVLVISSTFGDLSESLLKRSLNIKDSGNIMPGHGGFLDRFDAYFFSVPFVIFTMWVFGQLHGLQLLIDYIK